ncbi:MAG: FtsX-like permease family protein [Clostridiales bacterium]|nr:FtsX-like permease family protein [Clostridiales bacterium]
MKYIMLKTLRDIRETIGSFISILLVLFIGCLFLAGVAEGSSSTTNQIKDYYASQLYATARAEYMYVNAPAVEELREENGVIAAMGYDTFNTKTKVRGIRYDMTITTLTDGIDVPLITAGRLPEKGENEIIIDEVFADAHNVEIGAKLDFSIATLKSIKLEMSALGADDETPKYTPEYENVGYSFTVCGIYHSPDVIYKVNLLNTAARTDEFILAHIEYGLIKSYLDTATVFTPVETPFGTTDVTLLKYSDIAVDVFNGIKIRAQSGVDAEELFSRFSIKDGGELTSIFADPNRSAGLYMYSLKRSQFPSVVGFDSMNDTITALTAVLPMIFFAVAAAIMVISLSKTVENQRMQIGIIQALGVSKSRVYFSYMFYALFASLVGAVLGGLAGTFFMPWLLNTIYLRMFSLPPTPKHLGFMYFVLSVVISAVLSMLAAFISCYRTLRSVPAQAMRPKPPKKTRRILVERWTGLWKRLGFGAKMNLRNMFLHKMRMLLSSVGIIGCLALLVGLIGLKDNMSVSFTRFDATVGYDMTIVTDVAVDLMDDAIYDSIAGAEAEEYMHNLTFVPNFSGRVSFNDNGEDITVMALPTYADEKYFRYADADCIKLFTDLDGKNRVLFEEDTFVIPEMTAKRLGVKAGDTVKVTGYSLDNRSVSFEIKVTAIVREYFDQKAYCSYAVFKNNDVGLYANTSYATFLPGVDAKEAVETLKNNEVVRDVKTFSETFAALEKQMSLLDYAVIIFVVGAAALAIAVIYNITATNLKERTREIATLMVLGYKRNETANMVIVENMVITLLGCIIGLPLGYGLMLWLGYITEAFKVYIASVLSWYVAVGCIALTFAFSLVATMLLNTRMKNISMVEALKSVE